MYDVTNGRHSSRGHSEDVGNRANLFVRDQLEGRSISTRSRVSTAMTSLSMVQLERVFTKDGGRYLGTQLSE